MSAELDTIEESIKIALDAADAATDITSEYNKVKREHKKLEAKVKQIHRYTTIIFGSSILASVVAIGFSSVLYFKSMSDLSVMTTTNREALVIFAENVDALKETTNNLKMAMDNQALIQDQNKKVLNKIEVMRDDFKTTTTSMQTQVKSANEQLSGEIANFSGQLSSTVSDTLVSQMNGQLARIESLINGIQDSYSNSIEGISSTKLMYVTRNADIHKLIISDADGFNEEVLLKSNNSIISPAWSTDAKEIAYVSFENNRAQVFTQNLATGQRSLILSSKSSVSSPAWSPNNKDLAFTSTKDGNSEIYTINLKSKKITRLTENLAIDTEPAWSPDGRKIIFTSDRSGSPQIYEIDVRSKLKRRLTTEGSYNARASYLDKSEIIFVHRSNSDFNIAKLDLSSRNLEVLTSTKNDESPCIAPNGNVIIYSTKEGNLSYLAGVNISSKVSFKLPALYGELKEPAWSPFLR